MKLKEWLDIHGMTEADLARHVGVTRAAVNYWIIKGRGCRPATAEKIERLTKGEVTYRELTRGTAA